MKTYSYLIILLLFSCTVKTDNSNNNAASAELKMPEIVSKHLDGEENKTVATLNIEGMTCEMGCAKSIQSKLSKIEGVQNATVDFKNKIAIVEFDKNTTNEEAFFKTITSIKTGNYSVTKIERTEIKKQENGNASDKKSESVLDFEKNLPDLKFPNLNGLINFFN
jgi:Cu+-exporting ATPase